MAAISATCCLNLPPKTAPAPAPPSGSNSSSSLSSSKTDHISWPWKERSWKRQCLVSVTCVILSLEMSNLLSSESEANAQNLQLNGDKKEVTRWSDKRTCPPWQLNSLETIVPENLPRPSARRRWKVIGHSTAAPAIKFLPGIHTKSDCFSM